MFTYAPATRLDETAPPNEFAAKHSIPYNVAVRAVLGHNGVEAYRPEVVHDPRVRSLMSRIEVIEDPASTAAQPAVRAARVEVHTRDGQCLVDVENRAPGGFDHPTMRSLRATATPSTGRCTVFGESAGSGLHDAVLRNAATITVLQRQDGYSRMKGHPAIQLVAVLLALAED